MKKISEEVKKGEIARGLFEVLDYPNTGDTYSDTKITTYEYELTIPYKIIVTEGISPGLDKDGKPKEGWEPKSKHSVQVDFPFSYGNAKGRINLHVYSPTLTEVPEKILEAVGSVLAAVEFKGDR